MKKLYFLDESEKERILNMHKDATKKQYLIEQPKSKLYKRIANLFGRLKNNPTDVKFGKFTRKRLKNIINDFKEDMEGFVRPNGQITFIEVLDNIRDIIAKSKTDRDNLMVELNEILKSNSLPVSGGVKELEDMIAKNINIVDYFQDNYSNIMKKYNKMSELNSLIDSNPTNGYKVVATKNISDIEKLIEKKMKQEPLTLEDIELENLLNNNNVLKFKDPRTGIEIEYHTLDDGTKIPRDKTVQDIKLTPGYNRDRILKSKPAGYYNRELVRWAMANGKWAQFLVYGGDVVKTTIGGALTYKFAPVGIAALFASIKGILGLDTESVVMTILDIRNPKDLQGNIFQFCQKVLKPYKATMVFDSDFNDKKKYNENFPTLGNICGSVQNNKFIPYLKSMDNDTFEAFKKYIATLIDQADKDVDKTIEKFNESTFNVSFPYGNSSLTGEQVLKLSGIEPNANKDCKMLFITSVSIKGAFQTAYGAKYTATYNGKQEEKYIGFMIYNFGGNSFYNCKKVDEDKLTNIINETKKILEPFKNENIFKNEKLFVETIKKLSVQVSELKKILN